MVTAILSLLQEDEQSPFHTDDTKDPVSAIFDPMPCACDETGQSYLTSPLLLAIQALVYSHAEWFRVHFHEAFSALTAFEELARPHSQNSRGACLNHQHRLFVAALVAHQTLLRQALALPESGSGEDYADRTELAAYYSPRNGDGGSVNVLYSREHVAPAIARTLLPFLPSSDGHHDDRDISRIAVASVLCGLCLENRHGRLLHSSLDASWWHAARSLVSAICASARAPEDDLPRLVFFQYGHFVQKTLEKDDWQRFVQKCIQDQLLPSRKDGKFQNVTFSFDRRLSRTILKRWSICDADISAPQQTPLAGTGTHTRTAELISASLGWQVRIHPPEIQILLGSLGLDDSVTNRGPIEDWLSGVGNFLPAFSACIEALKARHPATMEALKEGRRATQKGAPTAQLPSDHPLAHGYFPAPLVGHVLKEMRRVRPLSFSILRLCPVDVPRDAGVQTLVTRPFTVYLPRDSAGDGAGTEHAQSQWLIARYIASMIIGLEVSVAPRYVNCEYFSSVARDHWSPLVERALRENGHKGILSYLEQYHSAMRPAGSVELIEGIVLSAKQGPKSKPRDVLVLGLDIGAGGIKCGIYEVHLPLNTDAKGFPEAPIHGPKTFPTAPGSGQYEDAQQLAIRVRDRLAREGWPIDELDAIGIAWPGAIRDNSVVAATSKILENFKGFERLGSVDARAIHALNLPDAFRRAFPRKGGSVSIQLLNDGDADIKGEQDMVPQDPDDQRVCIILKAGTGTACGLYARGRQVPLLAELGKAVLNLMHDPLPAAIEFGTVGSLSRERSFPSGTVNRYCSSKTLPAVADALGWRAPATTPALDAREIGYFLIDKVDQESARDERKTIAKQHIFKSLNQRFSGLLDDPEDVAKDYVANALQYDRLCLGISGAVLNIEYVGKVRIRHLRDEAIRVLHKDPSEVADDCARVAGYQLADTIALTIDLFRCKDVYLGGGALTGATGLKVKDYAVEALESTYGFAVDDHPVGGDGDSHTLIEVRDVRIHGPDPETRDYGVEGAARAAIERLIRDEKLKDLRKMRAAMAEAPPGDQVEVEKRIEEYPNLTRADLAEMLDGYMTILGYRKADETGERYVKVDFSK